MSNLYILISTCLNQVNSSFRWGISEMYASFFELFWSQSGNERFPLPEPLQVPLLRLHVHQFISVNDYLANMVQMSKYFK